MQLLFLDSTALCWSFPELLKTKGDKMAQHSLFMNTLVVLQNQEALFDRDKSHDSQILTGTLKGDSEKREKLDVN